MEDDIRGIEVKLLKSFSIIRETLERIGIRNNHEKKIWPSCYVYVRKGDGKVFIAHFRELLRNPNMLEADVKRKNTIIWLLSKWNLIKVVDRNGTSDIFTNIQERKLCILNKDQIEEESWEICHKIHKNTLYYHSNKTIEVKNVTFD